MSMPLGPPSPRRPVPPKAFAAAAPPQVTPATGMLDISRLIRRSRTKKPDASRPQWAVIRGTSAAVRSDFVGGRGGAVAEIGMPAIRHYSCNRTRGCHGVALFVLGCHGHNAPVGLS
jgi:hypothetical protein